MNCADPGSDTPSFLTAAPDDLATWVAAMDAQDWPVLADTGRAIEDFRNVEDDVDAHMIAEAVVEDPLMTLKLLRHVARLQRPAGREHTDSETVTEALVMLGITPFFRSFGPQPSVEDRLARYPEALEGLRGVLKRSRRAARMALAFAIHRQDHDAAVIHEAALLHDFAEMLLWVNAPALALEIQRCLRNHPGLTPERAQQSVLNLPLSNVQQGLMKAWRLPALLARICDDQPTEHTQVRNVQLAIRIALHSMEDWNQPELTADVEQLSTLLSLGVQPTWHLLRDIGE